MQFMLDAIAVVGLAMCLAMLAWHVRAQLISESRMTGFHRWMSGISREPSYMRSKDE